MKFKKIDREYLLTDNSVNCYGFRLLTEGYLLDEFKKNPIGYLMHLRDKVGVIVKWEDFRIEGDLVYAKPVINMSHERGQQTVDEIENGFLNAASVGHLVVLEYSDDPAMKLPGQSGPTITKWFNRECSLVDIPGNFNALALYDKDEQPLNLADFTKPTLDMKTIVFTGAQLAALNLTADKATDINVSEAFNDLVARAAKADTLQKQVNDLSASIAKQTEENNKKEVSDLLATARKDKKITVELSAKLEKDYAQNPTGLKDLLASIPATTSIVDELNKNNEKKVGEDLAAKSWSELHESGKLVSLKANNPELYKQKFREEFGHDPK